MSRAGCFEVDIGIESGNDRIQKAIGKNLNLARVRQTIETLTDCNIKTKAFFIMGFADESWTDIQDTINFAIDLKDTGLRDVAFFPAMPFPGTELASKASQELNVEIHQGAVIDSRQKYVGSYALDRLRKYAAMPEVALTPLLTPRQLRLLCAFAYTSFESNKLLDSAENEFNAFANEQETLCYGS